MTAPETTPFDADVHDAGIEGSDTLDALDRLADEQAALRSDFERLAHAVAPLLTRQFQDMETRVRQYEQRLRLRQERPLIVKVAALLTDVRRLGSDTDARAHVDEYLERMLTDLGYQPFGAVGDPYDVDRHEALDGRTGRKTAVRAVHSWGLECCGDVIVKARVTVEPWDGDTEPGRGGSGWA